MSKKKRSGKENIHAATDREQCEEMRRQYGWELIDVRPVPHNPILKVNCVFDGEQTSFEDTRYETES